MKYLHNQQSWSRWTSIFHLYDMQNFEKIFLSFIDQLSQQNLHEINLINLHSRRIQRNLRFIEATQNDCWTTSCNSANLAFEKKTRKQIQNQIIRDVCYAWIRTWNNSSLLSESEIWNNLNSKIKIDVQFNNLLLSSSTKKCRIKSTSLWNANMTRYSTLFKISLILRTLLSQFR